ncbi:hypothetical protein T07_11297 [Trichinella nelsoni]|uniref:Uncharacterized protein n=1 Tax=Trichinella nelsoni TaxID=6336 RepID=A0A0V0S3I1_9BILA|nr:hypothetical protein T07_11297 [Trichinella nelsoni]
MERGKKLIAKSTSTSIVCVCFLFTSTDVEHRQLAQQDHGSRRLKHHRQFENTVTVCVVQILRCSSICTVEQQLCLLLVHNHNTGHRWYGTQRRQTNERGNFSLKPF